MAANGNSGRYYDRVGKEMFSFACAEEKKVGYTDRYKDCENPVIAPENWPLKYLICKAYYDVNMQPYLQKKLSEKKLSKSKK